ncbi:MAG: hypothetical protein D3926_21530 [Desulfobacteraceae bacterium]|nr:MAG: hypothetical protein D3926_21530 [Desulfobacteraceae bacterium]
MGFLGMRLNINFRPVQWSAGVVLCLCALFFVPVFLTAAHSADKLPLAAGILVNKAQAMAQKGEINRAVQLLEAFKAKQAGAGEKEIRQKGYDHYFIYFLLGNWYSTLDQAARAAENYKLSVKRLPGFSEAWLNLARVQYETADFNGAAESFLKGYDTSEAPKAIYLYYAAVCRFQAGGIKKNALENALAIFKRIEIDHPDEMTLEWKETLVNIYFGLDRYSEALPYLEELAEKSEGAKQKQWREVLLYQYLSLNMKKKALSYARFLTREDTLEPKWWKALCHIHLEDGRQEKALSALLVYGYLTPMDEEEKMLAADLYMSLEVPGQASLLYEEILRNGPDKGERDTVVKLVNALTLIYDRDRSLAFIEKGLAISRDKRLLRIKARLLFEDEAFEKAMAVYRELARIEKKPGQSLLMLGYCAMNLKQYNTARESFLKAKAWKNQKKPARQMLKQIDAFLKEKEQARLKGAGEEQP